MKTTLAQVFLYGGALTALGAAFAELAHAPSWAAVVTPTHVFGFMGAVAAAVGALHHPVPGE
jgi:hypothetical protein